MEEGKNGRMEEWKKGRMEEWKNGRMGKMEEWKNGRMGMKYNKKKILPCKGYSMTRFIFLSVDEGQEKLHLLPIPNPNKTVIALPVEQRAFFKRLWAGLPIQQPLGFDIFNIPIIKIIQVQNGHPFTLGTDTIVFPRHYFELSYNPQRTIFTHELVHLHQRKHPALYLQYYRKLGFVRAQVEFSTDLARSLMYNPDGEHYEWIWIHKGQGYVPLAINHKAYVGLLGKIFPAKPLTHSVIRPVEQIPEYYTHFQTVSQLYHPNEIVAHQITDHLWH